MKSLTFFSGALCLMLFFSFTNPTTTSTVSDATAADYFKADFVMNMVNCDLETRFETQFSNRVPDVTHIDVHQNEVNGYYYAVYGVDLKGTAVVEYFKTTAEEVANEEYNYIQMNERTMNAVRVCREATTFPFPFDFCHLTNNGPICGIEIWPNVCIFY